MDFSAWDAILPPWLAEHRVETIDGMPVINSAADVDMDAHLHLQPGLLLTAPTNQCQCVKTRPQKKRKVAFGHARRPERSPAMPERGSFQGPRAPPVQVSGRWRQG